MITKEINTKSLAEVYYIISNLEEEYKNKIPDAVTDNIIKYMDKNYEYIEENEILPETKALLAVLIEKYFDNIEFNKKLKEYNQYYFIKTNEEKEKKYNTDAIFPSKNNIEKENSLIEIQNNKWYEQIWSFFRNIFRK